MPWPRLTKNLYSALGFIRPFRHLADPYRLCPAARLHDFGDHQHGSGDRGLSSLIFRAYDKSCSDPRDRVFALLGLLHNLERDALGSSLPDYGISQRDLFTQIVRHLVNWHGPQFASRIVFELLELLDVPNHVRPLLGRRLLARLPDCPKFNHPELSQGSDETISGLGSLQDLQLYQFADGSANMQTVWEVLQDEFGLPRR